MGRTHRRLFHLETLTPSSGPHCILTKRRRSCITTCSMFRKSRAAHRKHGITTIMVSTMYASSFLVLQQRDGAVGMPESDPPGFFLHGDARPRIVVTRAKHHRRTARLGDDRFCVRCGCHILVKPSDPPRQPLTALARPQPLLGMVVQPQGGPVPPEGNRRLAKQADGPRGADGHGVGREGTGVVWEVVFGRDWA